jgi:hypothetical protein
MANDREYIARLLQGFRHWNEGAGLIVPAIVGNKLLAMGFKEGEGFTISRYLPASPDGKLTLYGERY